MNDTHVQEGEIIHAQQNLGNAEAYNKTASLQAGGVAETQGGAKWSNVQGASRSSEEMRRVSEELSRGMQSAAKTTKAFCELINATHREFVTQDEQGKQEMAQNLQDLCDVFDGYSQGTRSVQELNTAMSFFADFIGFPFAGLLDGGSGDG